MLSSSNNGTHDVTSTACGPYDLWYKSQSRYCVWHIWLALRLRCSICICIRLHPFDERACINKSKSISGTQIPVAALLRIYDLLFATKSPCIPASWLTTLCLAAEALLRLFCGAAAGSQPGIRPRHPSLLHAGPQPRLAGCRGCRLQVAHLLTLDDMPLHFC